MKPLRILFLCHNHPSLHPGGTEIFAHELFHELKGRPGVEALFVGCTNDLHRERKPGTLFQTIGRSADELLLWVGHFDRFYQSQIDVHAVAPELRNLLRSFAPDIVHVHHTLLVGVELFQIVKRTLPAARIVFTLHDYYSICANEGQMVTTGAGRLCERATADACHRCFPEIPAGDFVLRETFLKTQLGSVDRFLAPSRFLRDRYVQWGIEPERIDVLRNGIPDAASVPHREPMSGGRRDRFAFFGHINRFKGAMLALEAARLLEAEGTQIGITLHGGLDFQTDDFQERFRTELGRTSSVRYSGGYRRDELPGLVADADWVLVPSTWWENAPLVIEEALQQRRPVICSDIGGMAERIRDGVEGLHFRAGDAASLAAVMCRAAAADGPWDGLVRQIAPVRTITAAADDHERLYRGLASGAELAPATPTPARPKRAA
jgi:glycosyltransferase involved in cell wall biosynthesis